MAPKGNARECRILIRLSEDEKARCEAKARALGLGLGSWMRSLALEAAEHGGGRGEMTKVTDEQIEAWATECAKAAIDAGGPDPFDIDGNCILPGEPLQQDWVWLDEQLDLKASADQERAFARAYSAVMDEAIERVTAARAHRKEEG